MTQFGLWLVGLKWLDDDQESKAPNPSHCFHFPIQGWIGCSQMILQVITYIPEIEVATYITEIEVAEIKVVANCITVFDLGIVSSNHSCKKFQTLFFFYLSKGLSCQ